MKNNDLKSCNNCCRFKGKGMHWFMGECPVKGEFGYDKYREYAKECQEYVCVVEKN